MIATQSYILFYVNGKRIEDKNVDPEETLLYYLRKTLHLTGSKLGCGEGGCGACTVMVSSIEKNKVVHRAVNACLAPIASVHMCSVITVEGIGSTSTRLHAVQQALVDSHGTQCGFCTPGIVMSMYTLVRNVGRPTEEMIERALQGNLCRCTGYRPIIQGFKLFSPDDGNEFDEVIKTECAMGDACCKKGSQEGPTRSCSTSNPKEKSKSKFVLPSETQEPIFPPELKLLHQNEIKSLVLEGPRATWYRPTSLSEILSLKSKNANSKIITGNTEVCLEVKFRGLIYPNLISPVGVRELNEISFSSNEIIIGSAVTLNALDSRLRSWISDCDNSPKTRFAQAIVEILQWFAGDQIRNVSAIGGNLMTASPISDLSQILMAAGAIAVFGNIENSSKTAKIDENFFTGYRRTVIPNTDLLIAIKLPYCADNGYFKAYKQSKRKEDDIAIVNSAFYVEFTPGSDKIKQFRAAYGGMGPTTRLAVGTNTKMIGRKWSEDSLEFATDSLGNEFNLPPDAPGGFIAYRKCLVTSLFFKFFITIKQILAEQQLISTNNSVDFSAIKEIERKETSSVQCYDVHTVDAVGRPLKHRSAEKQATGEAEYVDDLPVADNELYFAPLFSTNANAKIQNVDWSAAKKIDGIIGHVDHSDIIGENSTTGAHGFMNDDEFMRSSSVSSCGQIIGGLLATSEKIGRQAIKRVKVTYDDIFPVIITLDDAITHKSYLDAPIIGHTVGEVDKSMETDEHILESEARMGGQEHFYFETNAILCSPIDNGKEMNVVISCQNLDMAQEQIANVLGVQFHQVHCHARRVGGGFGGKETRFHLLAGSVATAAVKFNRPVRCMLDRDEDMIHSGTRHPFLARYKVGFNGNGRINSVDMKLYQNSGYSMDLSMGTLSRAVDHSWNCYNFPNFRVKGYACKTNTPSNTAFRGFGGPQGMFFAEDIICKVADYLSIHVDQIRRINFAKVGDRLPYSICEKSILTDEHIIQGVYEKCHTDFETDKRRIETDKYNRENKWKKRGLAVIPTMFGIAFGLKFLNQGGALVHIYRDGSVLVSHGGIEMGQGLYTKMIQIASKCLNIPVSKIHTSQSSTTQVPNASPSAASYSSDINGWAVRHACEQLMERLSNTFERHHTKSWEEIISIAYHERISLSAAGFWRAQDITWDPISRIGKRWNYYCYGTAAAEVEIDLLTGEHQTRSAEIVMDVGRSLNPVIDIGQIEGAFMQGVGLFTMEDQLYSKKGHLLTRGPGAYKIPGFRDIPSEFKVSLYDKWSNRHGLYHSKAVGEPPLFMGSAVFFAIRDAIGSTNEGILNFDAPATVENIRMSLSDPFAKKANESTPGTDSPWCVRLQN